MTEVVAGVLKFSFGLITNKIRSYGAEKLRDGDVLDQKFSGLIVRELDNIKFKLDANARRELFASISSLQQGVERLSMCFEQYSECVDASTSELPRNKTQSQDTINAEASTSSQTKPAEKSVRIQDADALANAVGKLKVLSSKRFESAEDSFKQASREAKLAFHNAALSTTERVLSSKVRIASAILEHLADPEFAVNDCLQYLRELHDLPAIQDVFSVHIKAGIISKIKSGFQKDSRIEIVETITLINLVLADFISKYTEQRMAVLDWPMIKSGKRYVHPIYYNKDSLPNLKEIGMRPPWDMVEDLDPGICHDRCALNKKRDLVCDCDDRVGLQKLIKTTGNLQPFCLSSQETHSEDVCNLAVDEDDAVYVLSGNESVGYTLSVYSADGKNMRHCTLKFLRRGEFCCHVMTITKDKDIVICSEPDYSEEDIEVWLCDTNGKLKKSFTIDQTNNHSLNFVSVSCNNEILLVTCKGGMLKDSYMLHVYAKDGSLQRIVPFRPSYDECNGSTCYSEVTENLICFAGLDNKIMVEFFSDQTGDLVSSYILYKQSSPNNSSYSGIFCHADGTLALVDDYDLFFLQTPLK